MLSYLRILGHQWLDAIATLGRAGRIWWFAFYRNPSLKNLSQVINQIY